MIRVYYVNVRPGGCEFLNFIIQNSYRMAGVGENVFDEQSEPVGEVKTNAFINPVTHDFDFDAIEKAVLSQSIGFGNPDSKWTAHEQFLYWKRMLQEGLFRSRDEYCNILVRYSTYQEGCKYLDSLRNQHQAQP